jgi:hypothetical protein
MELAGAPKFHAACASASGELGSRAYRADRLGQGCHLGLRDAGYGRSQVAAKKEIFT